MESWLAAVGSAFWLGILTSVSPCPLAANVAAISYVGKRVGRPRSVMFSGLLYTLGRMVSYFIVAFITVESLASMPTVARFLQGRMNQFLGPILIVAGILLLDVIPFPWTGKGVSAKWTARVDRLGVFGALLLGLLLALTFCPVSAALFFGTLLPLTVKHDSSVSLPLLYGLGTGLPVAVFAMFLAFATHRVSAAFNAISKVEPWMRRVTAVVFVIVGVYYAITYLFT